MNNTFHDEATGIEYIIPAPRQLSRQEAEIAIELALETYAESALALHIQRHPETKKDEFEALKQRFRNERVEKQRGLTVLIHVHVTEIAREKPEKS